METKNGPAVSETTIWLVEDHALYRRSTAELIGDSPGLACPVAVASCEEALEQFQTEDAPDIVLMDIALPGMSGIEGIRRIRALSPSSRLIMLTVHEEKETIFEAICAGASGYLLKSVSPPGLIRAIREVQQGAAPINPYIARKLLDMFSRLRAPAHDYGLTRREKEILHLLVEGLTMKELAARLFVSFHTVDTHIRNIYEKLHVHSRSRAVTKALRERLV